MGGENYGKVGAGPDWHDDGTRYPIDVLEFQHRNHRSIHPTAKPVTLLEYLIRTYTNEGDVVLDNCMGGGTTAVACVNTKRHFIGFEINEEYFAFSQERLRALTPPLFA